MPAASASRFTAMPGYARCLSNKISEICGTPGVFQASDRSQLRSFPASPATGFAYSNICNYSDSACTRASYNHWSYIGPTPSSNLHTMILCTLQRPARTVNPNCVEGGVSKLLKDLTSQTILNRSAPSRGRCIPPNFTVTSCCILSTLFSRSLGLEFHHHKFQVPFDLK